jgi:hypothetical protein
MEAFPPWKGDYTDKYLISLWRLINLVLTFSPPFVPPQGGKSCFLVFYCFCTCVEALATSRQKKIKMGELLFHSIQESNTFAS